MTLRQVWNSLARFIDKYRYVNTKNFQLELDTLKIAHTLNLFNLIKEHPSPPENESDKNWRDLLNTSSQKLGGKDIHLIHKKIVRKFVNENLLKQSTGLLKHLQNNPLSLRPLPFDQNPLLDRELPHPEGFSLFIERSSIPHPAAGYGTVHIVHIYLLSSSLCQQNLHLCYRSPRERKSLARNCDWILSRNPPFSDNCGTSSERCQ
eukprot:TRINITY_DN1954_c0_g1_i3.p1 TRINITY_DN1954_c0_g1~~TRINITY_DN1954_c0_g1_i3.p1  ORF type:complete len:206 (-),score=32.82 TRINITY_DN1954_c0_g1_i3:485-1102(-)